MREIVNRICRRVNKRFPCRARVVRSIAELIGDGEEAFPSAIYVFGDAGTGKTAILREIVRQASKYTRIDAAFVDSIECYTTKILLGNILSGIAGQNGDDPPNCDTVGAFINELIQWHHKERTAVAYTIVIDNAERLRDMDANVLPTLLRLPELTGLNVCCVLASKLPFEKFYCKTGLAEVLVLHCSQYTKCETQKILCDGYRLVLDLMRRQLKRRHVEDMEQRLQALDKITVDFFANYLNLFLSVFYKACRDLPELRFIAHNCFAIYVEPVLMGTIDASDVTRLWRHIAGPLRTSLSRVYMRIEHDTSGQHHVAFASKVSTDEQHQLQCMKHDGIKSIAQSLELPYYAKLLLIAAYLASHNSSKEDKRLFVKDHGRQRKRVQSINAKSKNAEKMSVSLGPKSFCIDRLLAIFYAILEEKVGLTCNLLSQISTLVHLKLLNVVAGENNIMDGVCRLQCTVSLEFILHIGKVVGFNVRQYLCEVM